jgi:purine-binding chemotaxis protein CheW
MTVDHHTEPPTKDHPMEKVSLAGKYLNFRLDSKFYAFPLLRVREIIRLTDITPVPRASDCIRGIINLRGKIIPVVDLRKRFGLTSIPDTAVSCIIVVDIAELEVGVVVDSVAQVVELAESKIEQAPAFGMGKQTEYILGIGKSDTTVTLLLNLNHLMLRDDLLSATSA